MFSSKIPKKIPFRLKCSGFILFYFVLSPDIPSIIVNFPFFIFFIRFTTYFSFCFNYSKNVVSYYRISFLKKFSEISSSCLQHSAFQRKRLQLHNCEFVYIQFVFPSPKFVLNIFRNAL